MKRVTMILTVGAAVCLCSCATTPKVADPFDLAISAAMLEMFGAQLPALQLQQATAAQTAAVKGGVAP